jgi:hypothetical protein
MTPLVRTEEDDLPGQHPVRIIRYGGHAQTVAHVAATWVRPAIWWSDNVDNDPLASERIYVHVVLDARALAELFSLSHGDQQASPVQPVPLCASLGAG